MSDNYAVRYKIEPWGKPRPKQYQTRAASDILVSNDDHGYADNVFVASIIHGEDGSRSVLLMDFESGSAPTSQVLRLVLNAIRDRLRQEEIPA